MDLKQLTEPLEINEIDFRIQSINKGGYATVLAYKDARVDMNKLDSVCGALNWKREHTRDNQNCIVSIWDETKNQWVSKEDTGAESFTEKEKGLASDSFKRACFNWGIGRELYDYPVIQIKLKSDEFELSGNKAKQTWNLKLREWVWSSKWIGSELISLSCVDNKGAKRFSFSSSSKPRIDPLVQKNIESAIKKCKSLKELQVVWYNNPTMHKEPFFSKAKDDMKKMLQENGIDE